MTERDPSRPNGLRPLKIEAFDPAPSIRTALEILAAASVPYALAGRIAVWAWVETEEQEFTKDVDFAVPARHMASVESVLRARGFEPLKLSIGGVAVRTQGARIDFIDRRVEYAALFEEAVQAAHEQGTTTTTEDGAVVMVVPAEYLVAMKMATGDRKDERDVVRLLGLERLDYDRARSITREHAGPASAMRLDRLGAEMGRREAARYVQPSDPVGG